MKTRILYFLLAGFAILFSACESKEDKQARESVDKWYASISSDEFRQMAIHAGGITDVTTAMTDSAITLQFMLQDDMHLHRVGAQYAEMQRQQTIDNYRMVILKQADIRAAIEGMARLGMVYRTVFIDAYGDSAVMIVRPEEILGNEL